MQTDQIDFDRLTAGLATKSDKIRVLGRHGVKTADIARYLGIRYQHARNVLVQGGLHRTDEDDAVADVGADRRPRSAWAALEQGGRLTLPVNLMAACGLAVGPVHLRLTVDGIEILSPQAALARAQAIAAPFVPGSKSVVDEFIAERHRDADHE
ncbi:MAG: hypothetical protein P4M09_10230 [Devosia sp.]|nr:hypothetical protein [Devosia sp.]